MIQRIIAKHDIEFRHEGKALTVSPQLYGPSRAADITEAISREGLRVPSITEVLSFVSQHSDMLRNAIESEGLLGYTGVLFSPAKKGGRLYFIDNPCFQYTKDVDAVDLYRRLSESKSYFVTDRLSKKKEITIPSKRVARSELCRSLLGIEGAANLAAISQEYKEVSFSGPSVLESKASIIELHTNPATQQVVLQYLPMLTQFQTVTFGVRK